MTKRIYILKVLNNNAILTQSSKQNTAILIGRGIGFGQSGNTYSQIDESKIEKSFFNYDETLKTQLIDMITTFDENIIEVSNQIIDIAEKKFGELNQHVYISLTDHISFAIDRLKNNHVIENPFYEQIRLILAEEYQVALQARDIIYDKFNITIPDHEVGFIAFHINAARENIKVNYVVKEMRTYKEIVLMVETYLGRKLDSTLASDLYLIIQKIVKKEQLPLSFLIKDMNHLSHFESTKLQKLYKKIINYIEDTNSIKLQIQQKSVLAEFIKNIK